LASRVAPDQVHAAVAVNLHDYDYDHVNAEPPVEDSPNSRASSR
jgi:hypothetical protein